jgi:cell division protein FtsQ
MSLLFLIVVSLYAFTSSKNSSRKVESIRIKFVDYKYPFLTEENVSKLLIQKNTNVTGVPKEILDLNELETALNENPIIKNAEVYMSVNGELTAKIEQKNPIARVSTNASYYIDESGSYMPLSSNYSARVPLVTGQIEKNNLKSVFKVAQKVYNDDILNKHVVEIHQNQDKTIYLKLRQNNFKVNLGDVDNLDRKIGNLKAFYQKALKDKTLNSYSIVNLQFDNQVVCTKK